MVLRERSIFRLQFLAGLKAVQPFPSPTVKGASTTPISWRSWHPRLYHYGCDRWVLACRDSLAVARGLCEEVTIVAHSTGAPVAALVAETFDVERLIFTGPNFLSQAGDRW